MSRGEIQVVKVGGSLLPRGPQLLRRLLHEAGHRGRVEGRVLVVGGGALVDALRHLDAAGPLGEEAAHWLAIDLMAVNARAVATWLGAPLLDGDAAAVPRMIARGIETVVFDPRHYLRRDEPVQHGTRLPIGWDSTSDSIAARIAAKLGAGLTLLKSSGPSLGGGRVADNLTSLAGAGYVDPAFPAVAEGLGSIDFFWPSPTGSPAGAGSLSLRG